MLLVDDNPAANFLHKKLITISGEINQVHDVKNGLDALDYINQKKGSNKTCTTPNIILLDLNMPIMNGWEFLEKYSKLNLDNRENTMIIIVTTSVWEKDKEIALNNNLVADFMEKPLTKESFKKISDLYYKKLLRN